MTDTNKLTPEKTKSIFKQIVDCLCWKMSSGGSAPIGMLEIEKLIDETASKQPSPTEEQQSEKIPAGQDGLDGIKSIFRPKHNRQSPRP